MKMNTSVVYSINREGYNYHIKKGVLKKGSTISKKIHPISEVEDYKKYLLKSDLLSDRSEFYILKKNIKIGCQMSYNLHVGEHIKNIPNANIVLNPKIKNETLMTELESNFYKFDDLIMINNEKNSFRLESVYQYENNFDFFIGEDPSSFSKSEEFVVNVLEYVKEISQYRHGYAENKEADIIDIINNRQIEILTEFKSLVSDRNRRKNPEQFFIELYSSRTLISKALMNKLFKKEYTDEYKTELAILTIGTAHSILNLAMQLDFLFSQPENLKTKFKKIHLIVLDPISDTTVYLSDYGGSQIIKSDFCTDLLKKKRVEINEIMNDQRYFFNLYNFIMEDHFLGNLPGKKLKMYLNELKVLV